jgi:hypothetical protein
LEEICSTDFLQRTIATDIVAELITQGTFYITTMGASEVHIINSKNELQLWSTCALLLKPTRYVFSVDFLKQVVITSLLLKPICFTIWASIFLPKNLNPRRLLFYEGAKYSQIE